MTKRSSRSASSTPRRNPGNEPRGSVFIAICESEAEGESKCERESAARIFDYEMRSNLSPDTPTHPVEGAAAHYSTSESAEVVTRGRGRGEGRCEIEAATLTSQ